MDGATQRVVILMRPDEKRRLERKARQAKVSVGELVRRSVESYDPEERTDELEALVGVLEESTAKALAALDRAETSLDETLAYFAAKRGADGDHRPRSGRDQDRGAGE